MSTPARQSDIVRLHQAGLRAAPDVGRWQASPDDHILPVPSRSGRRVRKALTWSTVVTLAGAALWSAPDERYRDPVWLVTNVTSTAASVARAIGSLKDTWPGTAKQIQGAGQQPESGPLDASDTRAGLASAEPNADGPAQAQVTSPATDIGTSIAPPAGGHLAAYAPPPKAPVDPLRARAEAVGLNPDISLAVLARLSQADFQNAGTAINTALSETADDGVLLWPRQRTAELALFQIHFVPGAPSGCRRYVVTITKDRWSATALPMERCGGQPVRAKG